MINRESIAKMKDGVVLVNCARGGLMDMQALIEGIESEKIGALGLDTVENEEGIIHRDRRDDIFKDRESSRTGSSRISGSSKTLSGRSTWRFTRMLR